MNNIYLIIQPLGSVFASFRFKIMNDIFNTIISYCQRDFNDLY